MKGAVEGKEASTADKEMERNGKEDTEIESKKRITR